MSINGLEITEISIHPVKNRIPDSSLEAFARVVFNDHFLVNLKVVKGKFGHFISYPSSYDSAEDKHRDLCFPITRELKDYIADSILSRFRTKVEQALA